MDAGNDTSVSMIPADGGSTVDVASTTKPDAAPACLTDADCKTQQHCMANVCRGSCDSDKDCTPFNQLCDKTAGFCVTCLSSAQCAPNQYCNAGACAPDVCQPGTSKCDSNGVANCNADGSKLSPPVACPQGKSCAQLLDTASCQNWVCPPMVSGCASTGEKTVLCSADGLMQTLVDDCGAKGQVCAAATCKPVVCQANALFCSGKNVMRCSAKGDASTVSQTCGATQYCADVDHTCKAQVCSPSVHSCNGNVAVVCNTSGSGYLAGGTDCASSGQICVQGGCSSLVCPPSNKYCELNTVRQCGSDGLSSTLYQTCLATEYCDVLSATCKPQICTPNQPVCNVTVATTCNSTGSGYAVGGTDCSLAGQTCAAGACKPIVCTPNAYYCTSGTIRQCSADGTSSDLRVTCTPSQYCDSAGPTCKDQVCTPGQPACDSNVATTCNADGSGFTGNRVDCTPSAQSCLSGQCTGCVRIQGSTWARTLYATSTPWSTTMTDGANQIPATGYGWVGWFEYDVNLVSSGNVHIVLHVADDGWHELKPDALYNQFQILVDGSTRLAFDANTMAYDDGVRASGDLRFHNVTGTTFNVSAGSHVVHFDNIADKFTGGDDLSLFFSYFDICSVP
jgi:hypothetical protein